jgi:hypothetical protein
MRAILTYLQIDLRDLLERHGRGLPPRPGAEPLSIKDEAIGAGVRYGGGATEAQVRTIADKFEPVLQDEPIGVWVETLLREIRAGHVRPRPDARAVDAARAARRRQARGLSATLLEAADGLGASGEDCTQKPTPLP